MSGPVVDFICNRIGLPWRHMPKLVALDGYWRTKPNMFPFVILGQRL